MINMMPASSIDDRRWDLVNKHDRSADGAFVYAVATTGVYCRPSCPSRRPRRDHVQFFENASDAERAGFRACRRCRPDRAAIDPWVEKIQRACAYLTSADGHPSLAALARRVGGSPYHLQRNFKRLVGVTPREYAEASRVRRVKRALRNGADVTSAMFDAGFQSSSRFYERAVPRFGMAPSTYRRGGDGMDIVFATAACPLGRLLIAATSKGVCAVAMGNSDGELRNALTREYPRAAIAPDRGRLAEWIELVLAHLSGAEPRLDLPLDIRATAFESQVWQAIADIPYGQTRSYRDLAAAIGRPGAVRAVANACGRNPVALAIPCHRVVPAGGGSGGYRWGAGRKEKLLATERYKRD
jgi:AraC family transcriptional regulator, regulatory protein of adaptative response / methylated-DNA-[protein]-cysteine methyltransferase